MGELILCKMPIAGTPYYIDEKGLNIYSLEELSFYISHNTYLMTPSFMNQDLITWIRRELHETTLAEELTKLMEDDVPLHIFCGHILESNGFLTTIEIRDTMKKISQIENKSEAECRKIRADGLLNAGKLTDSIYEYENLLHQKDTYRISIGLEGDIWHNLGTAYAKLFFFREAEDAFQKAYERNHREMSLRALLTCYLIHGDEEGFQMMVDHYLVPPKFVEEVRKTVSGIVESESYQNRKRHVEDGFSEGADGKIGLNAQGKSMVRGWKDAYIKQCRL